MAPDDPSGILATPFPSNDEAVKTAATAAVTNVACHYADLIIETITEGKA